MCKCNVCLRNHTTESEVEKLGNQVKFHLNFISMKTQYTLI